MSKDVILRLQRRIDTLEMEKTNLRKQVTGLKEELETAYADLKMLGGPALTDMRIQAFNTPRFAPKELRLIILLLLRKEGMTKERIMMTLYDHGRSDAEIPQAKIVDVMICKARRKLLEKYGLKNVIVTVWGKGYLIPHGPERDKLMEIMGVTEDDLELAEA